jgi:uncharacterized cupin superfamily protein
MAMLAATPVAAAPAAAQEEQEEGYARASAGTRQLDLPSGTRIKLLLEAANLGSGDIEVAEITFPVGTNPTSAHRHGATEIFYVVEGVLDHVVNGTSYRLEPGMVGVVRGGDEVEHRVLSDVPVKAVVLWLPGGEAARLAPADRWGPVGGAGGGGGGGNDGGA